MSDTTKTEMRVINGWISQELVNKILWDKERPGSKEGSLVIGDKAVPMSKVEAMLREVLSAGAQVVVHANEMEQTMRAMDQGEFKYERDSYKKARRAWITIAAKYGIKLP